MNSLNENTLSEQPVIEWLKEMGYEYAFGPDIAPGGPFMERTDYREVVLEGRLLRSLRRINPDISENKISEVARQIIKFTHQDLEMGNKEMYEMLTRGIKVDIKDKNGDLRGDYVKIVDFKNPDNNEFLVVNQFSIEGFSVRIPDVVIFINGIPIALFELKSPIRDIATIADAFSQIHDLYKKEVPKIFFYNQVLVVSDLSKARHGTVSAGWDFFTAWKGIESENEKHPDNMEMELMIKGLFQRERILDIIQNFIIYEADAEKDATKFTKKMCMYHQYFGVKRAVENTIKAVNGKRKKIGVFWHTQGSGKSLSMVFYANKVKKLEELNSPTLLFLTDRNDLDQQLYKTFLRTGYPFSKQAESIRGLTEKLKGVGSEILFTTIQKFDMETTLSERENLIVISDEAHRSQYAKLAGNVRDVLPNASFMGITGTPVELANKNTRMVFGDYVTEYPIDKSVEDGTTVPIYYEGRLAPLHLLNEYIDEDFDQLVAEHSPDAKEIFKKKWAGLEEAVGSEDRLKKIAWDIIYHYNNNGLVGKAMVVTMSRRIAVDMYKMFLKINGAPEIAVVISSNQDYKGQIQKELDNKELEKRFKNPNDPLRIVIVCDMWLTGFDVPALHTLYLDKALKGHTLMQAVARVNRRYKDKVAGFVVDYIGVADNLKKALAIYTSDIQKQAMIPLEELVTQMLNKYGMVKEYFVGIEYKNWKKLPSGDLASLFSYAVNAVLTDSVSGNINHEKKKNYLIVSSQLYRLFSLVMPHKEANAIRDDIEFFEGIRKAIVKNTMVDPFYIDKKTESAIKELVSKGIVAEDIIDLSGQKGQKHTDISILDDKFLEDAKNSHFKNLTIESIRKIIYDEIKMRMKTNIIRYKTLKDKLLEIIEEYENNIINSSKVIERMIELAKEIRETENAGNELGLSPEEMAFYDALSNGKKALRDKEMKELVKEIVRVIKKDIAIDWTDHEIIKARIRSDVRLVLLRHDISFEDVDRYIDKIYNQAFYLYKDYPQATK